jgi:PhnB protein
MSDCSNFIPHIVVSDAKQAILFYKAAFGAHEIVRHQAPGSDKLMHVHLIVNGGHLMLNDDLAEAIGGKPQTPEALGGSPVTFHLQVMDADLAWERAIGAGAEVVLPLKDQFWGDRYGILRDPFGYRWSIGQTITKPTAEEVERGARQAMCQVPEQTRV